MQRKYLKAINHTKSYFWSMVLMEETGTFAFNIYNFVLKKNHGLSLPAKKSLYLNKKLTTKHI